jgi:hypothetical protein
MERATDQPRSSEPHLIRRPLGRCPACASANLDPVTENDTEEVHFLCRDCGRCWHVELGYVQRMTPDLCHGCPARARCEQVYAADHAPA